MSVEAQGNDEQYYRELLTQNYDLVVRIVRATARRYRLSATEVEELTSRVGEKLVENGYATLRKFRGQASLSTYLTTVIARVLLDHRNERWGRCRPSVAARRLGATAVRLEMLMYRDGLNFQEACEVLRTNWGAAESTAEFDALCGRLPSRVRRRMLGAEALEAMPAAVPDADRENLLNQLERSVARLPASDQRMLRLRFSDGWTIRRIALTSGRLPKPTYRYFEQLLRRLRHTMSASHERAISAR